jgi:hypothetical protein
MKHLTVHRRSALRCLSLAPVALVAPALLLAAPTSKLQSLSAALAWLDALEQAPNARSTGAWPLGAVLEHLAQSIDMSVNGFPQPKSALFQNTVGAAAFQVFKWRGKMNHGLAEPIPGAPALTLTLSTAEGVARLRQAIRSFQAHGGALQPHFAYGALSRADYERAHSFHMANHQDEIVLKA